MMTRFALNSVGLFHLCAAACLLLATLPTSVGAQTPPAITSQPVNQTVDGGQSATLSVTAGGTEPLSYQWLKDGKVLTGATSSAYTIPSAGSQDVGFYRVRVGNAAGSVISRAALLMVSHYYSGVVAWGHNDYGQTDIPAGLSGVVGVAAGGSHTVAL